mgnify:CR=1 FL=1
MTSFPYGLHCGDCQHILPRLPPACLRACITHPPYWQGHGDGEIGGEASHATYCLTLAYIFRHVRRVLQPSGDLWLILDDPFPVLDVLTDQGWSVVGMWPWDTDQIVYLQQAGSASMPPVDPVWEMPRQDPDDPIISLAQYATVPSSLIQRCMLHSTVEGEGILDPFAGSGTTGVVAQRLRRPFIGIEYHPIAACVAAARLRYAQTL